MKNRISITGSIVASIILALCLSVIPEDGVCKTYRLKFQMAWHTQHPQYKAYQEFIKRVAEATDGQLKFTVFPASQLIGRNEALDGLKNGTIDMLASCGAYYHGMVPEGDVDWLPYVSLNNREKFWEYMNNNEGGEAGRFHDIIYKAYQEKANAVWLTNVICGSSGIIGRGDTAYDTVDSLKNIKLRAAGGVSTRVAKAWGASPVTMATGEIYPALQRGTVDALLFYAYGLKDYKFFEVAKTFSQPPVFTWADDLWINQQALDRLPEHLKKTLVEVAREWGRWASVEYWPNYEEENKKWCIDKGVNFVTMDDANIEKSKEMLEEVWDWYAAESPGCGQLVALLRAKQKEWGGKKTSEIKVTAVQ
ncbi:TRAP transporter substrate-binding protein [Desulforhopalus singaporensis]|uniref:TRAP-type C4-dicarboxylate transport system, substrate-binding protein n=1 Tax=Desulforhopalus singaporensis TaxID=91360 RepID=A0A1H0QDC8_9BACT|nr:TRAP transporter substrate-binding protein DctP [Desulforhopalus singaporensis]SDP15403.1 TRAP-type C4-dicarboxylate transport system, substrate-binding protein [Desulforhopalus singaporensis]